MDFRTIVSLLPAAKKISHSNKLLMFGSCFTESIGQKLENAKFSVDINPFGVLYNPISIVKSINRLINKELVEKKDLFCNQNLWRSFAYHSSFSGSSVVKSIDNMNNRLIESSERFGQTDFLLITFGTAWIYELAETGEVVSNCHKLPENKFKRHRLTVDEIVEVYSLLINRLLSVNKKMQIVFTVSPIRHWKDGAHENTVSKSILLMAVEELEKRYRCVNYFPAYELIMDDLRDYRFYGQDMLHPNQMAIDYIWERFQECFFTLDTQQIAREMEKMTKAIAHKPFNQFTEGYQQFCEQQLNKIYVFEKLCPEINFEKEIAFFKSQRLV